MTWVDHRGRQPATNARAMKANLINGLAIGIAVVLSACVYDEPSSRRVYYPPPEPRVYQSPPDAGVYQAPSGPGAYQTRSDWDVSASFEVQGEADFYEPLAPYGAWVEIESYGRCWRPASTHVSLGWNPFSNGHWVWTHCGWYWVSDEPWAWACYHYGSWGYDSSYGWGWVPGTEWAPAWGTWRERNDYIG